MKRYGLVGEYDLFIDEVDDGEYYGADEVDDTITKIQTEIDELEQFCINIYMSLHVSELPEVTVPVEEAWHKGQKLWLRNTKHKGE